jgi:pectinesterase
MAKSLGLQGLAAIVGPKALEGQTEDKLNHLLLGKANADNTFSYWAGFAWDRAGQFTNAEAWQRHVDQFAQELLSPIEVSISTE